MISVGNDKSYRILSYLQIRILLPLPTLFRTSENEESFLTLQRNASTTLYSIMGMATIRCLREGFNGRE